MIHFFAETTGARTSRGTAWRRLSEGMRLVWTVPRQLGDDFKPNPCPTPPFTPDVPPPLKTTRFWPCLWAVVPLTSAVIAFRRRAEGVWTV